MDKTAALADAARDLVAHGLRDRRHPRHRPLAGRSTASPPRPSNKVYEGRPNIVDRLKNDDIALVMNTTEGTQAVSDSRDIRRVALMDKIPYFTTAAASIAAVAAMKARGEGYGVRTLQGGSRDEFYWEGKGGGEEEGYGGGGEGKGGRRGGGSGKRGRGDEGER